MSAVLNNPKLVYGHEPALFLVSSIIGALAWLIVVVGTFGGALIYLLFGFIAYLFVQSGFIAHLRGNAVELGPEQYSDLHDIYLDCCRRLDIAEPPTVYLMMSDGIINALATKFLRRRYVVLFSSVVEALHNRPEALRFYFGHELGHIKQGHLNWSLLRWPASTLPLLGAGYRRSQEYTCDLHGLACCDQADDAVFALSVLAAGNERWSELNVRRFAAQSQDSSGFWMSFHELTGDYPWLSKRVAHVMACGQKQRYVAPSRHPIAWFFALFVPRLGVGGGASGLLSLMIVIAILGILMAIAIPAYQDYTMRAKIAAVMPEINSIQSAASGYVQEHRAYPGALSELGIDPSSFPSPIGSVEIIDDGIQISFDSSSPPIAEKTILLQAYVTDDGEIQWRCDGGSLPERYRTPACRP